MKMVMHIHPVRESEASGAILPPRSGTSIAFEQAWSAIHKDGLVPDKAELRPERFAPFLRTAYLVELHDEPERRILFRIAGETIRNALGVDLRGRNYIDFVPEPHRETSGISMNLMFAPRPCGRWVRKEVVHRDGFRQILDLTQFPVSDRASGHRLVIGIVEGFGEDSVHAPDGGFRFDQLDREHFIDIGAGLP
jgi:hypothetical protein